VRTVSRKVWGIDLGRSAVKGVLLEWTGEGVTILSADIVSFEGPPPDPSQDPTRDGRLWKALSVFREKHRQEKAPLCIAIPAQNTFVRDLTVARVGRRKLDEMVRYEAANEIPFVLDEVVWDYALFKENPAEPTRSGLLFAVKKNTIQTYLQVLAQLEMPSVALITLSPLALLNFLRLELGNEARVLALDIGAENTNMLAANADRFWLRNMLSGGNRVTALLQEEFQLEFEAAQKAKENIGQTQHARQILTAAQPAVYELMRNVKTNLTHLERTAAGGDYESVFVLGGGAKLTGLKRHLSTTLQQEVQTIAELRHVAVSPQAEVGFVRSNLDRLAVAIGAGLAMVDKEAVSVSFLPREEARAVQVSRARRLLLAAGIAAWAIMVTLYIMSLQVHKATGVTLEKYRKLASLTAAKEQKLSEALNRQDQEQAIQELLNATKGKNQAAEILDGVVATITAVNRTSPYRFQIQSFACNQGSVPVPGGPAELTPKPAVPLEPQAVGEPTILGGYIKGRIMVPASGAPTQAYRRFAEDLLPGLRALPALVKLTGDAVFRKGEDTVTTEGGDWTQLVQEGDMIAPASGGRWYAVAAVLAPNQLKLTQPFASDDYSGKYLVSRVLPGQFNEATLEFTLQFEVPRVQAPSLAKVLESSKS